MTVSPTAPVTRAPGPGEPLPSPAQRPTPLRGQIPAAPFPVRAAGRSDATAGLRLLPTPASDPAYDDPRPASRTPVLRLAPPPLRLVPALEDEGGWSRPRTRLDGLSPAQPFAQAFVRRLVEVLAGVRPVVQLQRDTTPELYARLHALVVELPRATGARPDARAVRSVHVQTRPEGIAEACATVKRHTARGPRATALALRLEGLEGRWCCTELVGL